MTRLRLSEWANIAEVIGGIAVVISLMYLGVQIRDNTREVRIANRQQLVDRAHAATRTLATDPQMAGVLHKVAQGEPLTPTELIQYGYLVRTVLYDVQEAFLLNQEGRLDDPFWITRAGLIRAYMGNTTARELYERDRALGTLHAAFVRWMDSTIAKME